MDIPHILYRTVGNDFEKFLGPKELLTMSKVSRTTREGDLGKRFRHLLDVTLKEFEIFKKNNDPGIFKKNDKIGVTMDDFLKNIPIGVIYRNHVLEPGTDFNLLLDHFNCNEDTRIAVFIELTPLDKFKEYMDGLYSVVDGKVGPLLYNEYIFQASIRGRDDIIEYLFGDNRIEYSMFNTGAYKYYPISQRSRDLFVKHESTFIDILFGEHKIRDPDEFGFVRVNNDRSEILLTTVWLCTCFQEQDIFIEYYLKYNDYIPDTINDILQYPELQYNINKYNIELIELSDEDPKSE